MNAQETMESMGWVMEREPFRRFRGPPVGACETRRTLIPGDHLSDAEAWQKLHDKIAVETRR